MLDNNRPDPLPMCMFKDANYPDYTCSNFRLYAKAFCLLHETGQRADHEKAKRTQVLVDRQATPEQVERSKQITFNSTLRMIQWGAQLVFRNEQGALPMDIYCRKYSAIQTWPDRENLHG